MEKRQENEQHSYQYSPAEIICQDTLHSSHQNTQSTTHTLSQQLDQKVDLNASALPVKVDREPQDQPTIPQKQPQTCPKFSSQAQTTTSSLKIKSKLASHILFPNNISIKLLEGEQKLITEDCILVTSNDLTQIKIVFTNYRIAFVGERVIKLNLPLGYINKLCRTVESKPAVASYIELFMKNGQSHKLKFVSQIETSDKIFNIIGKVCYSSIGDGFAFHYYKAISSNRQKGSNPQELAKENGWVCNMMAEYERFGLSFNQNDKDYPWKFVPNLEGKLCLSYPGMLVIPSKTSDDILQKCLKYRCKERIPILSYAYNIDHHEDEFSCLWRAAQPKTMNQSSTRNFDDQEYIKYLGIQKPRQQETTKKNLVIYDIKPKQLINLMSNAKAITQLTNYKNAVPKMIELAGIPATRQSYIKALNSYISNDSTKWLNTYEQSKWLQNNYLLLREAFNIAQDITNGYNVLVQCVDGADRTPQLVALAQIIIDPYYRTFEGFGILIEKEFICSGHPFGLRLGWNKDKDKEQEKSPIMIQFLDCVYQLLRNYPLSFEFTSNYLAEISYELYSNRFGNFLCNSYQQQIENGVLFGTLSIWKYLREQNNELYSNSYYSKPQETDVFYLKHPVNYKQMFIWKEHFSKFSSDECNEYQIAQNTQGSLSFFHSKIKKQTDQFKELLSQQYSTINQLRSTLQTI